MRVSTPPLFHYPPLLAQLDSLSKEKARLDANVLILCSVQLNINRPFVDHGRLQDCHCHCICLIVFVSWVFDHMFSGQLHRHQQTFCQSWSPRGLNQRERTPPSCCTQPEQQNHSKLLIFKILKLDRIMFQCRK